MAISDNSGECRRWSLHESLARRRSREGVLVELELLGGGAAFMSDQRSLDTSGSCRERDGRDDILLHCPRRAAAVYPKNIRLWRHGHYSPVTGGTGLPERICIRTGTPPALFVTGRCSGGTALG